MWLFKSNGNILNYPTEDILLHYTLGKELGSGFSGVVRSCMDKVTGEKLACKSIKKSSLDGWDDYEDVRLEISIMKTLISHRNIIGLRAVYEDMDCVHLVMELCEGGDLFEEIIRMGPFAESDAAKIILQISESLNFCHSKGIMHRDVKPENILLVRKINREKLSWAQNSFPSKETTKTTKHEVKVGEEEASTENGLHVKLADFGLALFLGPFQEASGFAGSPYYVAPEVLTQSWYGKEADIWSLGVVMYVILSGEFPFAGKNDAKLYKAIKKGKLNFCNPPWPDISTEAKNLIRQMLSLNAKERPTAQEVMRHPWIVKMCYGYEADYRNEFDASHTVLNVENGPYQTYYAEPKPRPMNCEPHTQVTSNVPSSHHVNDAYEYVGRECAQPIKISIPQKQNFFDISSNSMKTSSNSIIGSSLSSITSSSTPQSLSQCESSSMDFFESNKYPMTPQSPISPFDIESLPSTPGSHLSDSMASKLSNVSLTSNESMTITKEALGTDQAKATRCSQIIDFVSLGTSKLYSACAQAVFSGRQVTSERKSQVSDSCTIVIETPGQTPVPRISVPKDHIPIGIPVMRFPNLNYPQNAVAMGHEPKMPELDPADVAIYSAFRKLEEGYNRIQFSTR